MHPKIKFIIDKDRDSQTLETLVAESRCGDPSIIGLAFFNHYPELEKYIKSREDGDFYVENINSVKNFINQEYEKNIDLMKVNMESREKAWENKKEKYFKLVDDLFEDKYWPKGKYIAYSTIWGIYPKFLDEKSFQIPVIRMDDNYAVSVIAHEMLHFIFYEYFLKNYQDYNMEDNSFFIWNVSEAFNEVVQNHPRWLKEFINGSDVYGGREMVVKRLQKIYYQDDRINTINLIDDIILEIKKSKEILLRD